MPSPAARLSMSWVTKPRSPQTVAFFTSWAAAGLAKARSATTLRPAAAAAMRLRAVRMLDLPERRWDPPSVFGTDGNSLKTPFQQRQGRAAGRGRRQGGSRSERAEDSISGDARLGHARGGASGHRGGAPLRDQRKERHALGADPRGGTRRHGGNLRAATRHPFQPGQDALLRRLRRRFDHRHLRCEDPRARGPHPQRARARNLRSPSRRPASLRLQ